MNLKKLILCVLSSAVLVGLVHADIRLSYPVSPNAAVDVCSHFTGSWTGDGDISADVFFSTMHCHYTGTVNVASTFERYNVHVDVSSKSSWPCPDSETIDLAASCSDGIIVINSNKAHLNGKMSPAGNSADMTGTLNFTVAGNDVTANVDRLHLQR